MAEAEPKNPNLGEEARIASENIEGGDPHGSAGIESLALVGEDGRMIQELLRKSPRGVIGIDRRPIPQGQEILGDH